MAKFQVDGELIEAPDGTNLLQALLSQGVNLPYFCWHPAMGSVGACRQCAVVQYANEEDERGRVVMACMTPVAEDARFSVSHDTAASFRDAVVENLMLNHPHDCPVCEEGGECHLQDMTVMVGHRDREYRGRKTTFNNQYLGPFIGHEMNRCITCYRCVRYYGDYAGGKDLSAFASRDRVFFGRAEDGLLQSEFAGNLVEVCPTGVFTDKTLSAHYTRKWDLQSAPTICTGCALGCNTFTSERYGEVRRVHNRYHHQVNSYFLCDRGRFGAQYVNGDGRIRRAGVRNDEGLYEAQPLEEVLAQVRQVLNAGGRTVGIGSPRASLEANYALRKLVGPENYSNGMDSIDQQLHRVLLEILASDLNMPSMMEVESYDAIVILGEDVTNHAPRLALAIRQAVRNLGFDLAKDSQIPLWHDAAVREIAQQDRSPLIVLTPMSDRLDDVATHSMRLSPDDISEYAQRLADRLLDETEDRDHDHQDELGQLAALLAKARRPLVITGTSLLHVNILKSAANLALALAEANPAAGLFCCPTECNATGVAMLDNRIALDDLFTEPADLVLVLENDLALRHEQAVGWLKTAGQLVVFDHTDSATASESTLVLPAATFAEAGGVYINNEGRAQKSFAVFPAENDTTASSTLLLTLLDEKAGEDNLLGEMSREIPAFSGLEAVAPGADFRIEGNRIARMSHRYSGRTAMRADISVHEPKQPVDEASALAFTMEGTQQGAPAELRPFSWSPGWNSNQSIHKFQSEVGGADEAGDPGFMLTRGHTPLQRFQLDPTRSAMESGFVPQHHIFGSEPLSALGSAVASLAPSPYLRMTAATATALGASAGDGLEIEIAGERRILALIVDDNVAEGCIVFPVLPETVGMISRSPAELKPVKGFSEGLDPLRPNVITTDGGR